MWVAAANFISAAMAQRAVRGGVDTVTTSGSTVALTASGSSVTGADVTLNGSNNTVTAVANDTLTLNGSNNIISGAAGDMFYETGGGNNKYNFARGGGVETIAKNAASGLGKNGELDLAPGIASNQLWFEHKGNDLQVDILGTTDHVTVKDWYSSDNAKFQAIKTSDGNTLTIDAQFNLLVQNLATFGASHSAFNPVTATAFPNDPALQSTLAASWHS